MTVEIDRGRIAEPIVCANCSAKYTMTLIHNRSSFTDKQMVKLQESPGMYHVCVCVCMCVYVCVHVCVCVCACVPYNIMHTVAADDMPAGQTPHTVTLYAHHDLVDSVQPGDR